VAQAFAGILIAHVISSFDHQTVKVGQTFVMSKTMALQYDKGGVKSPNIFVALYEMPHKFARVK